jgi:glycosyltransferase involved in cell wall biosynthesis
MKQQKLISIITPSYNRALLLPRAIASVQMQSYLNWELIIVDDGSTDSTKEVIDPYLKDSRIKYFFKENSGAAHTRNVGVDISKGDYLIFLDSDDEVNLDWLSTLVQLTEDSNVSIAFCGMEIYDTERNLIKRHLPSVGTLYLELKTKFTAGSFMVEKQLFDHIGGYDVSFKSMQHTELGLRLLMQIEFDSKKIMTTDLPLINVFVHDNNRIRSNPKMVVQGTLQFLKKYQHHLSRIPNSKGLFEAIVAHNSFLIKDRELALEYAWKSFNTQYSLKGFLRTIYYYFSL